MSLYHLSQVVFFQLRHRHSKVYCLYSMKLLQAESSSKDFEMKVVSLSPTVVTKVRRNEEISETDDRVQRGKKQDINRSHLYFQQMESSC